jgi:ADP-heptose:LPS heptosyltransferase
MAQEKNILIYRLGSLGDTIIALPCFHLIRNVYPSAKITILTNQPVSNKAAPAMDILDNSGLCDHSISYPIGTRTFSELAKLRQTIRQLKPDLLINLAAGRGWFKSIRDDLFFRSCGIKKIIGSPLRRSELEVRESAVGVFESESQRLVSRLASLGTVDLSERSYWDLNLTAKEKGQALELLPSTPVDTIAFSVGTKLPVKDWGKDNWEKLLTLLAKELKETRMVMLGSGDEWDRSEKMVSLWPGERVNLCGKTSPRVAAAILERCRLFIGHDSGPMHLASVTGIPTIGIFSWLNPPGQWFPGHHSWGCIKTIYPPLPPGGWNPGLQMKQSSSEGIWLTQPETVLKTALELWNFNPGSAPNPGRGWSAPNGASVPQKNLKPSLLL